MKLLTPGPLTTSTSVKKEMLIDRCTWDTDYKHMTIKIQNELLAVAKVKPLTHSTILMQGSGTFSVEATLNTALTSKDKLLLIVNGAYGERMVNISDRIGINYEVYNCDYNKVPEVDVIESILKEDSSITHVAMVHLETTTGILNPLKEMTSIIKKYNKIFILDAMSSFGGIPIDLSSGSIDFLISSANKCIEGVPGFGYVIVKNDVIEKCQGNAASLVLDLYDQWQVMNKDGKWRFTSPTHTVAAFLKALQELKEEGGVEARNQRYQTVNKFIRKELRVLGFEAYIHESFQSPVIATYKYPTSNFNFQEFYDYLKSKGFIIYPGKLTKIDTFRLGNIGKISLDDAKALIESIKEYMEG